MYDFCTAGLMFLIIEIIGGGIKAGTHTHAEITRFLTQYLKSTQPAALCFPGLDDAPCWEMCDFCVGMNSCYNVHHSCDVRDMLNSCLVSVRLAQE